MSFGRCLKRSTIVVTIWMVLRILYKVIFKFGAVIELKNQVVAADQKSLVLVSLLGTIIAIWAIISLLGGIGYYIYTKFKY